MVKEKKKKVEDDNEDTYEGTFGVTRDALADLMTVASEATKRDEAMQKLQELGGVKGIAENLNTSLDSGSKGSTLDSLNARKVQFGRNRLKQKKLPHFCLLFVEQFTDFTMILLLVAGIIGVILGTVTKEEREHGGYVEGIAILVTAIFVALLAAGIDDKKNATHRKLQNSQIDDATVTCYREGKRIQCDDDDAVRVIDICVGDVIEIKYGDVMIADCVFIEGADIEMNESALTGEFDAMKKTEEFPFIFGGTEVMKGAATVLVLAVGEHSQSGKIWQNIHNQVEYEEIDNTICQISHDSDDLLIQCNEIDSEKALETRYKDLKGYLEKCKYIKVGGRDVETYTEEDDEGEVTDRALLQKTGKPNVWSVRLQLKWEYESIDEESECKTFAYGIPSTKGSSVLEAKLDTMAKQIGFMGMFAALFTMLAMIISWSSIEFGVIKRPFMQETFLTNCQAGVFASAIRSFESGSTDRTCNLVTITQQSTAQATTAAEICKNYMFPVTPGCTPWIWSDIYDQYCVQDQQYLCSGCITGVSSAACPSYNETGTVAKRLLSQKLSNGNQMYPTASMVNADVKFPNGGSDQRGYIAWLCASVHQDSTDGFNTNASTLDLATPEKATAILRTHNVSCHAKAYEGISSEFSAFFTQYRDAMEARNDFKRLLDVLLAGITVLVVAIPEGLPLAVVIALVYASGRMQKPPNNCFVAHLDATETMGNATAICSDKTGTLTKARMEVAKVYMAGQQLSQPPKFSKAFDAIMQESLVLNVANDSDVVASKEKGKEAVYKGNTTDCAIIGFAYQCYTREVCQQMRANDNDYNYPFGVKNYPFNSGVKRQSVIVRRKDASGNVVGTRIYVKGASEIVLNLATANLNEDGTVTQWGDNGEKHREDIQKDSITPFADDALRTLGVAYMDLDYMPDDGIFKEDDVEDTKFFEKGLVLIGIVGIHDAIRTEVPDAIAKCQSAGVTVRMCTGDNLRTARAISQNIGLIEKGSRWVIRRMPKNDKDLRTDDEEFQKFAEKDALLPLNEQTTTEVPIVLDAQDNVIGMEGKFFRWKCVDSATGKLRLSKVQEDGENEKGKPFAPITVFDKMWPKLRVLARCSPNDKFVLVRGLMESKMYERKGVVEYVTNDPNISKYPEVVAVTGDGTNDAPALAKANVGFAMGVAGTDIAKAAGDILLLDDNFRSIVQAVKWGRNVYDSIGKFLQFQLTVNVVAIFITFLSAAIIGETPLRAVQLLWVNLIMDSFASLALATESPTDALLNRPPQGKTKGLLSKRILRFIISSAVYQAIVLCVVLFIGCQGEPECVPGYFPEEIINSTNGKVACTGFLRCENALGKGKEYSQHYTQVFNIFVLMQIFNEINARELYDGVNVFYDICKNWIFLIIFFGTLIVQIFIVQFLNMIITSGHNSIFTTTRLGAGQWLINLAFGIGGLIYGIIIRAVVTPQVCKKCEKDYANEEEIFQKQQEVSEATGSILNSKLGRSKLSNLGVSKNTTSESEHVVNPINTGDHVDEFQ